MEEERGKEGAALAVRALDREVARIADDDLGLERSFSTWERTSRRCVSPTTGPIRTVSSCGLPIFTFERRSPRASMTASTWALGAIARRIAVHFWPALAVISFATSFTNRSNSGVPGPASGARIAALSESRSAIKRTDSRAITG